jgi:beta-aspartyl-peptidase (threonine type)
MRWKDSVFAVVAIGALCTGLSPALAQVKENKDSKGLATALEAILAKQAADWNEGSIDAFMKAYWNSEDLTFSGGGKTVRGWNATRERYLKGYPDRETMGKLTFSDLEVFPLGDSAALMLGRFHLDRKAPASGGFTLVWRKIDGAWLIVHDHTSADSAAPQKKE